MGILLTFVAAALGGMAPAPPTSSAAPRDSALARAVDAWVRPLVDDGHLAGTLLIASESRVLLERSYGLADRERKIPVTPETRFNIASITKPMTILLLGQLVREGRLRLEDTLSRWLPEFPRAREITVDHLLRHRAGIPHRVTEAAEEIRPTTAEDVVRYAARHPLMFVPGEKSSYSSGGFSVLARVLELASGTSYGDMIEARLFRPLGMARSVHTDRRLPPDARGPSYIPATEGYARAPFQDLSFLVGAGSVYSTPRDVHRLVHALLSGALGDSARRSLVRGGALRWNGSTNGFRAFVDWDSATGIAVVFSGNTHSGAVDLLRDAVRRMAAGQSVAPARLTPPEAANVPMERLRAYEGTYQLSTGVKLHVTAREGRLWANDWVLVPTSDSTFFSPRDFGLVRIVPGPDGRVLRLDWKIGEEVWPAPRVPRAGASAVGN